MYFQHWDGNLVSIVYQAVLIVTLVFSFYISELCICCMVVCSLLPTFTAILATTIWCSDLCRSMWRGVLRVKGTTSALSLSFPLHCLLPYPTALQHALPRSCFNYILRQINLGTRCKGIDYVQHRCMPFLFSTHEIARWNRKKSDYYIRFRKRVRGGGKRGVIDSTAI